MSSFIFGQLLSQPRRALSFFFAPFAYAREQPTSLVATKRLLHSHLMDDDDCQAGVVEGRGRTWDTGMELYFRVPDWTPGTLVHAEVGHGVTGVEK